MTASRRSSRQQAPKHCSAKRIGGGREVLVRRRIGWLKRRHPRCLRRRHHKKRVGNGRQESGGMVRQDRGAGAMFQDERHKGKGEAKVPFNNLTTLLSTGTSGRELEKERPNSRLPTLVRPCLYRAQLLSTALGAVESSAAGVFVAFGRFVGSSCWSARAHRVLLTALSRHAHTA